MYMYFIHTLGFTKTTWTVEGGVCQMTILLYKPYFVKATTKGKGGMVKIPKKV